MLLCGIDEAGRGPVLGPMIMAGVTLDEGAVVNLTEMGVKDSKLLSREERESLFLKILGVVRSYKIVSISPEAIDAAVEGNNLNKLEARTTCEIINELLPAKVWIDLPDRNAERYCEIIRSNLVDKKTVLIAEHKADLNYVIVGAASILAKVTRDRYIELLKEQFGEDFGSGYMSDKKTQDFLEKHWDNDNDHFFRKKWASWQNKKIAKEQTSLGQF